MPMYQPSNRRKYDVGSGGQVLDLDTAVKDGILGCGGGLICGGLTGEKLDLKNIIEEMDSIIEVPAVFICPISLEPMQDPVTLCTGQTYERSNILKWFSLGHFTCPTTMQELWDDSVTPNTTLCQLINSWYSQKYLATKKRSEDVQGRAMELLETLKKVKGQARVQTLKEIRQVVSAHSSAGRIVAERGGIALLSSLLGPFTTHAVGSEAIGILVNLDLDSESNKCLMQPAKVSLMVDMLNEGSIDTKVNCTKLIESLIIREVEVEVESEIVSSLSLLAGLMRLVKDKRHPNGVLAGLRLLNRICSYSRAKSSVLSIGGVHQLVELFPGLNPECSELSLSILENLSKLPEGSLALKNFPGTIPTMVKLLMKISENCTQLALSISWAVCNLAPEECAPIAVDAGLAAKLLLVIQSGCNASLKQKAAELLKLCSMNYTSTIFISKCKLTRTMQ
ncbi:U-box domain-containing protein 30-like [Impatiens glandulifera]|uniref:U-box domain-containing protein 30-like n=1 Tax=Impatiens glandulifera TaxID=253017 RepID=UPI001FB07231|nr:U-box domain-containing protein 30-like [Impatiens glandulifera]XP_047321295.1 U-box domain-containing protein 30-like [Impatiens glandulifera]